MDQQLLVAIIEYILRNYDIEPDGTLSEMLKEYEQQHHNTTTPATSVTLCNTATPQHRNTHNLSSELTL